MPILSSHHCFTQVIFLSHSVSKVHLKILRSLILMMRYLNRRHFLRIRYNTKNSSALNGDGTKHQRGILIKSSYLVNEYSWSWFTILYSFYHNKLLFRWFYYHRLFQYIYQCDIFPAFDTICAIRSEPEDHRCARLTRVKGYRLFFSYEVNFIILTGCDNESQPDIQMNWKRDM